MRKLLSAALAAAIVIAGSSAARAGVVLTDENLDTITAGDANTDFNAISIMLPGVTLVSQCVGINCTTIVNGMRCDSCQLVVNQSGITVIDASGLRMQWPMTWPSSMFSTALVASLRGLAGEGSRFIIVGH